MSGILALISCACLALFTILSVLQMAMITSRDTVVLKYKPLVILKLTLAIVAALLALCAAILFAIEIDNSNRSFIVSRGISFYLQVSGMNERTLRVVQPARRQTSTPSLIYFAHFFFLRILFLHFIRQIVLVVLSIGLAVSALYDVIFAMRIGGDPTLPVDISAAPATTYNNPGFREGRAGNYDTPTIIHRQQKKKNWDKFICFECSFQSAQAHRFQ